MTHNPSTVYQQGFDAFVTGDWDVDENPHEDDEGAWEDWNEGYEDARETTGEDF